MLVEQRTEYSQKASTYSRQASVRLSDADTCPPVVPPAVVVVVEGAVVLGVPELAAPEPLSPSLVSAGPAPAALVPSGLVPPAPEAEPPVPPLSPAPVDAVARLELSLLVSGGMDTVFVATDSQPKHRTNTASEDSFAIPRIVVRG